MNNQQILEVAAQAVNRLKGRSLDIVTVAKPRDIQSAIELSKVVSKLSPIVGNTLESIIVQYLNTLQVWPKGSAWTRQDPDFPDVVLTGVPHPRPGLEIKAWFPLATEITAQFPYRLDTNFAKIDRIALQSLEVFKRNILQTMYIDRTVQDWVDAIKYSDPQALAHFIEPDTSSPIQ